MFLKAFIITLLTIQSFIGFCQVKKLEMSLDYSIGQSFRQLNESYLTSTLAYLEEPIAAQGINVQVKYMLNERLGIVSGLGYNQYGESINTSNLTFGYNIDPRIGFVNNTVSSEIKHVYDFLSVPLLLNYSIIKKEKSALDVQIGSTINYLFGSRSISKIKYTDGNKERDSYSHEFESNDLNFAGLFGIYYRIKLGAKCFIKVGPQADYFFTSISNIEKRYPYKFSINLGVGF